MPENIEDLIAEARDLIACTKTYNFGMWSADKLAHGIAGKLADALEAVSAERDAALAAIADAKEYILSDTLLDLSDMMPGRIILDTLSRIPERPKED